jgi:hypothetical protein
MIVGNTINTKQGLFGTIEIPIRVKIALELSLGIYP